MTERRFNETEVAAIFERAATSEDRPRQLPASDSGMTLADLQEIGREVGLAPHAIAEAAAALDATGRSATRRFLGLPLRVERVVQLDRRLSDIEWEHTVVALREIFDARGVVRSEGSSRSWANGNLQVYLEPSGSGYRLRLRTFKGDAPGMLALGLGFGGAAGAALAVQLLSGAAFGGASAKLAVIAVGGASIFVSTAVRVWRWARRRREQMAEVAVRVAALQASADRGADPRALGAGAPVSERAAEQPGSPVEE